MVCFENTRRSHYLTEKLANAYAAGCVPVYWGAPEAPVWLNGRAFLALEDDSDAAADALIDRMLAFDDDDDAYAAVFREHLSPQRPPIGCQAGDRRPVRRFRLGRKELRRVEAACGGPTQAIHARPGRPRSWLSVPASAGLYSGISVDG